MGTHGRLRRGRGRVAAALAPSSEAPTFMKITGLPAAAALRSAGIGEGTE